MPSYVVRFNIEYSLAVEADSEEEALRLAGDINPVDWEHSESEYEAELEEDTGLFAGVITRELTDVEQEALDAILPGEIDACEVLVRKLAVFEDGDWGSDELGEFANLVVEARKIIND